ncbi:MAG: class I SAM-dependent methyltransferase [Labilithrix sp.]|nr:class I SAM-dependent methyltransferase [Labilithrix sp.]MCW5814014.1 class I SAM-dependent methyltransferase [Labilithrix sp.]
MRAAADYFSNHRRRERLPWSLYHRPLTRRIARVIAEHGASPRVLIVGCGLETEIVGAPPSTRWFGCDIDDRAIRECKEARLERAASFAVCPGPYELPRGGEFDVPFDVVIAKEVIEHTLEPIRWARTLSARLCPGGSLVLTTPNYGRFSTLPLLEATALEWLARRDGFSRRDIHPTKFDKARLERLALGESMSLISVERSFLSWSLLGIWRRRGPP